MGKSEAKKLATVNEVVNEKREKQQIIVEKTIEDMIKEKSENMIEQSFANFKTAVQEYKLALITYKDNEDKAVRAAVYALIMNIDCKPLNLLLNILYNAELSQKNKALANDLPIYLTEVFKFGLDSVLYSRKSNAFVCDKLQVIAVRNKLIAVACEKYKDVSELEALDKALTAILDVNMFNKWRSTRKVQATEKTEHEAMTQALKNVIKVARSYAYTMNNDNKYKSILATIQDFLDND